MRRTLASLLLALLTSPVIVPILQAQTASSLPACCRLTGKHHCSMGAVEESSSSPVAQPAQPKCCYYPAAISVCGESSVALPGGCQAIYGSLLIQSASQAPTETRRSVLFSRSRQERGPPAFS